jgi:TetR/AcrR family transcriptional regulator, transcriptional repressor for nem operon
MARPRTFDETAVVDAARDRFWRTGYAGTSLDDLVEATGLARGSLYNAFGDKHSLYVRGFDSYCSMIIERVRSRLDGPDETAAERLRGVLRRGAANAGTADAPPLACFLAKASTELAVRDPQIAELARRTFTQLEELIGQSLSAAQRAGDISPERDVRAAARHILVALRGIEALASAGVDGTVLADAAEDVIRTALTP